MSCFKFLVFSDFHYKKKMYPASVENLVSIFDRAAASECELVIHAGDFCNDYIGSPELVREYLENRHRMPVFGAIGNHELESRNNSMELVVPLLSNRRESLVFGEGEHGETVGYYYTDIGDLRFVFLDTNYSLTEGGEYEHNRTASYGKPRENTLSDSLGPVQLKWLREALLDAANTGKRCITVSHATFCGEWKCSPDAAAVRDIFTEVNAIREGTVILAINGHYHTDRIARLDDVLYFDCNTAINGWWQSEEFHPYSGENAESLVFDYCDYDGEGNLIGTYKMPYSKLSMGSRSLFFKEPLSAVISVFENGDITVEGSKTEWVYGIGGAKWECAHPCISNYCNKNNSEA